MYFDRLVERLFLSVERLAKRHRALFAILLLVLQMVSQLAATRRNACGFLLLLVDSASAGAVCFSSGAGEGDGALGDQFWPSAGRVTWASLCHFLLLPGPGWLALPELSQVRSQDQESVCAA
jgi:hypothetical protein